MRTPSIAGGFQASNSNSFLKDGRKIRVGDCAFFKPPQEASSQEEVDHLISKTRKEMHATVLPGGCSPKTMNDAALASQVKAGSDGAQNMSSFTSKGKKRERSDADSEPVKRLHTIDDGESYQLKLENTHKADIARITDRGGLVDYKSVQKLIQLMVRDKADKKTDLTGRSILADVVAATDKFDCLSWFVQLKGLSVFDEWLREVHKGKIDDGHGHKDGDKSVEEFLLVLLRALDKLPVNLRALQMCNIGKSVNNLRSHKNMEIQRNARSLVDTWKKRVEAEMNIDDGKSGSNVGVTWHGRHTSEPSQGGHINSGSSENAVKSSSSLISARRTVSPRPTQDDTNQTTASTSPEYSKSALSLAVGGVIPKDAQLKAASVGESPDHPVKSVMDEKSSSSSQSLSQSSSSDHVKTTESSGTKDPRSSTAGSVGASKMLRRTSQPRRSISGLQGHVARGAYKEVGSNRSPLHKYVGSKKLSQSFSINEKMHDVPVANGNTHKLIVKIPNLARRPAMIANGGSINELCPSNSRAKSPTCPDKHEKADMGDASQLNDASDVTTKSWHSSDLKDMLTGSDEACGTSAANHNGVRSTQGNQTKKFNELPKVASPVALEIKPWKTQEPSFSPMNALVESCIKHCEANTLISAVDNIGINLLASVAASEMSQCDSVVTNSPRKTAVAEDSSVGNSGRSSNVDDSAQELTHCTDKVKEDIEKQEESASLVKNSEDGISSTNEKTATDLSNSGLHKNQDDGQLFDMRAISSNEASMELVPDSQVGNQKETNVAESEVLPTKGKHSEDARKEVPRGIPVHSSRWSNDGFENKASEVVGSGVHMKKESPSTTHSDLTGVNDKIHIPFFPEACLDSEKAVMDTERLGDRKNVIVSNPQGCMDQNQKETESRKIKFWTSKIYSVASDLGSTSADCSRNYKDVNSQNKEASDLSNGVSDLNKAPATKMQEYLSTDAPQASPAAGMEKLTFDLNEGFMADEVKYEEPKSVSGVPYPAAVQVENPPFSALSSGLLASVTVAAPAKGDFVPPEELLQTRGELGWKGSAATSAFRPAEPRKISELQVNISAPFGDPGNSSRPFLTIDLNVPDESMQDEMAFLSSTDGLARNYSSTSACGFGGLDLDLNLIDEATEVGQYFAFPNRKSEVPGLPFKPGSLFNSESCGHRNFDLNNGPMLEEVGAEASLGQNVWINLPTRPHIVGLQMNNAEMENFGSWFPRGSAIPNVLPDRGDQAFSIATTSSSQRMYYTPPGSNAIAPDIYRGPVLSSSPALSFPPAPYQYPVFPFGASFQAPSATLSSNAASMDSLPGGLHNHPTRHSQYLSHPGVVLSSYPRPYLVSIPDGRSNGGQENSNRWASHGRDLNSGPRSIEVETRNDALPFALRQFSTTNSQAFTEEQVRMFQASGIVLKRKEPDGGWDAEKPKQQLWP